MCTDYDCWHEDHDNVTVEMIVLILKSNAALAATCGTIFKNPINNYIGVTI